MIKQQTPTPSLYQVKRTKPFPPVGLVLEQACPILSGSTYRSEPLMRPCTRTGRAQTCSSLVKANKLAAKCTANVTSFTIHPYMHPTSDKWHLSTGWAVPNPHSQTTADGHCKHVCFATRSENHKKRQTTKKHPTGYETDCGIFTENLWGGWVPNSSSCVPNLKALQWIVQKLVRFEIFTCEHFLWLFNYLIGKPKEVET